MSQNEKENMTALLNFRYHNPIIQYIKQNSGNSECSHIFFSEIWALIAIVDLLLNKNTLIDRSNALIQRNDLCAWFYNLVNLCKI